MKRLVTNKKILLLSVSIIIVAAGGFTLAYNHFHTTKIIKATATSPPSPVNYGPPTQQDKDDVQKHKQDLAQQYQQQNSTPPPTGRQQVMPVITNASQIDQQVTVNAYVGGIFEDGGTCTATFTKDGGQVIKKTTAFANATTTDCPPFTVSTSEFPSKGDWQVVVSYNSPKALGASQAKTFTVH